MIKLIAAAAMILPFASTAFGEGLWRPILERIGVENDIDQNTWHGFGCIAFFCGGFTLAVINAVGLI